MAFRESGPCREQGAMKIIRVILNFQDLAPEQGGYSSVPRRDHVHGYYQ